MYNNEQMKMEIFCDTLEEYSFLNDTQRTLCDGYINHNINHIRVTY